GVMVDSNSYTNAGMSYAPGGKTLNIGGAYGVNGPWAGFPGPIDDIRIYNRALSDAEVVSLFDEPITGYACTPEGVADMDQGSAPYIYSSTPGVVHMNFGQSPFVGTLAIYNMLGQKIDEKQLNTPRLGTEVYTLQHGAKGMYLLVLTSGTDRYTYKFEL
ncbi:MAG TPA: LamG-like jellyroll fold domain-containing protein, partial [Bacteroidia bacterium]|nr:LamG-like jellyroll fold domain-containing protein [Bacteroidia bacterium]